ncbi:MAG: LysE family translocator [Caldilineaceae bacterium]|nr:LysE family translocator [Caldilineaceae bacterium]MCB0187764.1 LysE family translocator [Caldilineaceae bacterium]
MLTNFLPTITFILIATFSPGPSNISSAVMGVLHGYRKTVPFLLGMVVGFLVLMSTCAWAATTVMRVFPALQPILQYLGAAYIIYLAYGMLKASYTFATTEHADRIEDPLGFVQGFVLQALNPKLVVYGLALFSTFFAPLAEDPRQIALVVPLLATVAFCATSTWTLGGTLIKHQLRHPKIQLGVNIVLSLLLVYTALKVADLL